MPQAIDIISKVYKKGYSVMDIFDSYFTFIKICDILSDSEKYQIIKILLKYIAIFHTLHENEIELAFFTNSLFQLFK